MPSGENGCGMGETNSSRQPSFESDLHAVDGGQRRFLRLTLSDSWIGVRVVYGTGLEPTMSVSKIVNLMKSYKFEAKTP